MLRVPEKAPRVFQHLRVCESFVVARWLPLRKSDLHGVKLRAAAFEDLECIIRAEKRRDRRGGVVVAVCRSVKRPRRDFGDESRIRVVQLGEVSETDPVGRNRKGWALLISSREDVVQDVPDAALARIRLQEHNFLDSAERHESPSIGRTTRARYTRWFLSAVCCSDFAFPFPGRRLQS